MKRKIVSRLLLGSICIALAAPSGVWAAPSAEQTTSASAETQNNSASSNGTWIKSGNRWWYRHEDGSYTRSGWELIKGIWYYFDEEGWMVTGWQKISGVWYYMNESGAMQTGWQKINGSWYYMNGSGAMQTGWQTISGVWYYMNGSGVMQTGWQKINGSWYYMNGSGVMQTGWQTIDGAEYYLAADGHMVTGWMKENDNWYYLKSNGAKAYDYWVDKKGVGGYYIDSTGVMVVDTVCTIDGVTYTFDDSGKCISDGMTDENDGITNGNDGISNGNNSSSSSESEYLSVVDPLDGKTYEVEKQFATDPQMGTDVTEDELLAAAVYSEAGNQGMPGMTGVALVMLNRIECTSYPASTNVMLYQKRQFEVVRNGALRKYLLDIDNPQLDDVKLAVQKAREIMDAYINSGIERTVEGLTMPEGKTDFNYLGFMTPEAFEKAGLDPVKTEAFTYKNITFFTKWIKKS